MHRADTFFSIDEKERISAAIRAVEGTTAGEVAVMVVDESDSYPEGRILAGIVSGGLLALAIAEYFFSDSLWHFAILAAVTVPAFGWLAGVLTPLKRFFIADARLAEQVEKRALAAFYEKGLYKTRDATGVLFFISLLERRVWILADKGIYEKISQATLSEHAKVVAAAVKSGQAATVLCEQIKAVGQVLAEHFPIKADDTNELSDEVMID